MSEILSNWEKDQIRSEYYEKYFKRDMFALLIGRASAYHTLTDVELSAYRKGAFYRYKHLQALRILAFCAADSDARIDRYTREMRQCNQVLCRIQRERIRRGEVLS